MRRIHTVTVVFAVLTAFAGAGRAQSPGAAARAAARTYRQSYESAILDEFVGLLAIPNLATDSTGIVRHLILSRLPARMGIGHGAFAGLSCTKTIPPDGSLICSPPFLGTAIVGDLPALLCVKAALKGESPCKSKMPTVTLSAADATRTLRRHYLTSMPRSGRGSSPA